MGSVALLEDRKSSRATSAAFSDLAAQRSEYLCKLPQWLEAILVPLLRDKRDLPILHLFSNVVTAVLPAALSLFLFPKWSSVLGPAYLAVTDFIFLERYLLALHFSEHRKLFKADCHWMNQIAPILLAPLFGVPCGLYKLHHCVMHHAEDNGYPKDISSTEPYQRDNFCHFLFYWLRYLVGIWVELPLYAMRAGRWGLVCQCIGMETVYIAAVSCLWQVNRTATVWTLVVPLVITSFALMFGNWSQHIFIDPLKPHSAHGMSYNCVGFSGNQRSFNDGYHTVHHLNSKLHWTQLPQQFIDTAEQGKLSGLTFEGIGCFDVGLAVFFGKLDMLTRHLVTIDSPASAQQENHLLTAALKSCLKPITNSNCAESHR